MGVLIGGILGLIILGIMAAVRNSKAKQHAAGMQHALTTGGRKALDRRISPATGLFTDNDVERQSERMAALASLGEIGAVTEEMAAFQGAPHFVASVRAVAYTALALAGHDAAGQAERFDAELSALAANTNKLTLRAIGSFAPVVRALAGRHTLTETERREVLQFQSSPVVQKLLNAAFAKLG